MNKFNSLLNEKYLLIKKILLFSACLFYFTGIFAQEKEKIYKTSLKNQEKAESLQYIDFTLEWTRIDERSNRKIVDTIFVTIRKTKDSLMFLMVNSEKYKLKRGVFIKNNYVLKDFNKTFILKPDKFKFDFSGSKFIEFYCNTEKLLRDSSAFANYKDYQSTSFYINDTLVFNFKNNKGFGESIRIDSISVIEKYLDEKIIYYEQSLKMDGFLNKEIMKILNFSTSTSLVKQKEKNVENAFNTYALMDEGDIKKGRNKVLDSTLITSLKYYKLTVTRDSNNLKDKSLLIFSYISCPPCNYLLNDLQKADLSKTNNYYLNNTDSVETINKYFNKKQISKFQIINNIPFEKSKYLVFGYPTILVIDHKQNKVIGYFSGYSKENIKEIEKLCTE